MDVARSNEMGAMVQAAIEAFSRVDIMVNNAGMSHPNRPMLEVTEAFFDRLYQVNVKSIYLSAVHCVPVFRRQKSGCFINIGSTAAVRPRPGLAWYNGSKGAVTLLTKSLATELAADGIRANCICPGFIETPLFWSVFGGDAVAEYREKIRDQHKLGRFGRPEEIAGCAFFLASDDASFVSGQAIAVDGGFTAGHRFGYTALMGLD